MAAQDTVAGFVGLGTTGGQALAKDVVAYLSGPDEAKARALPALHAMTRAVHDVGGFGNGSAVKFIANLLFALASTFYAAALAQGHAGHDTACVHAVLRGLAGG